MDPSLSISSDPSQFSPFPPFSSSNPFVSGAGNPPNHPLFGGPANQNPFNNHVFQQQPQTQPQSSSPPPYNSFNHPPYSEMICKAIAALNEPDGSSKMAISRYIERFNTGLPPAHVALLTHHLKTLKNSGVLSMVKKSYKLAASTTPESVAVAAAAAAAGLDVPRSENFSDFGDFTGSASQPLKRGRGRPPKTKPEAQQTGIDQPSDVQTNGQPSSEQFESAVVINQTEDVQESAKRGPGRPRKTGSAPIVQTSVMSGIMKRRGRPPGRRAAGRQRKPKSVSSTASVFPYVSNGARRRGRPRRVDSGTIVPTGGEIVAVAPGMKRGRGRPPKIGGVMSRLMKPKRGRGRPVGRPRKVMLTTGATGTQDAAYGELKRKFDIFQEKAKEIVNVLKEGVISENQEVVQQAIQDLEGLIAMETVEPPQVMEEVQPEEAAPQPHTEAENEGEAQGEEQGQDSEVDEAHTQTEAQAMQEALF